MTSDSLPNPVKTAVKLENRGFSRSRRFDEFFQKSKKVSARNIIRTETFPVKKFARRR